MRILHVALDIRPDRGGPARSVSGLCKALAQVGADVNLFIHEATDCDKMDVGRCPLHTGSGVHFGAHWQDDFERVLDRVRPDVVHQHALWNLPLHFDDVICRKRRIPYLIAPRGLLDAWSLMQKPLKKKLALAMYQKNDLDKAAALHVTAESEMKHCLALGYHGKFIISPNGINMPTVLPPIRRMTTGRRRMLFLSRIHPKKGLLELVEAWASVQPEGWELEIVGNDNDNYWPIVQKRIGELKIGDSVIRTQFLEDREKWGAYRASDVFILPTHTENFGIVIAEALYSGLPVITTKGAPWKCIVDEGCGWWTDVGVAPLAEAIRSAISLSDAERMKMGKCGHDMVVRNYDWNLIAKDLMGQYARILE